MSVLNPEEFRRLGRAERSSVLICKHNSEQWTSEEATRIHPVASGLPPSLARTRPNRKVKLTLLEIV